MAATASDSGAAGARSGGTVVAQFQTLEGEVTGPQLDLPLDLTPEQLQLLINELLHNDEPMPYSFFVREEEIRADLGTLLTEQGASTETAVVIVYQPQALFRVRSVSRCTGTMPGHTEAVLSVHFSPDSRRVASGSGDTTVRLWDVETATPIQTLEGHRNWILCVVWSPDGKKLASASKDAEIRLWDGETGARLLDKPLRGHTRPIMALAWKPLHRDPECRFLASSSKDCTVRVWDTRTGRAVLTISGHTKSVTSLRWAGSGLIFTGSQDCTVCAWNEDDGRLVRQFKGHAHWVNTVALASDYVLRTGAYDQTGLACATPDEAVEKARARYEAIAKADGSGDRMVTGSDDFTLILWDPYNSKKPVARLTGHQQPVNHVCFSPDGAYIASASFDKAVKLWDGRTGKFVCSLRSHVGPVYQVAWSADSRLLLSASKDSTVKVWCVRTRKMQNDLPGHADEVFAVDWSPDGYRVVSGSKDRLLKIWRQ